MEENLNAPPEPQSDAQENEINSRLAAEFTEMRADFEGLESFAALPSVVKKQAAEGKPLRYAYLEYLHSEARSAAAERAAAERAARASAGSMAGDGGDSKTEAESRYLAALWKK